ncbi:hypothetical protein [Hungatella hathewayi]
MNEKEEDNIAALKMAFFQVKYQSYECNCPTIPSRHDDPRKVLETLNDKK